VLSPPVRRRCCVQRSRRRCTALPCRLRTRKPLGSCGFRAQYARTRSIVATCMQPGPARLDRKPCAANVRRADPNHFGGYHDSDCVSVRPAGRAARRCPAHYGSSHARRGLRCGSCRSTAQCPWRSFRSSPCACLSHAPSTLRAPASCELDGWTRAQRGPGAAATPSTAWPHRDSSQERAAAHRSTTPPTPQRHDRCPPRCPHPDRRSDQGCGRTQYASDPPDRG